MVADALSRKSYINMAVAFQMPLELCAEFESLNLGFVHHTTVATFEAEPTLEQEIRKHQKMDEKIQDIRNRSRWARRHTFVKMNRYCMVQEPDLRARCGQYKEVNTQ